jgi:4-alpha-glucanotransferase
MTPASDQGRRQSGILLHLTSLPSRYGIGDMGPAAFEWIDRLRDAGQTWWQVLPLGATGYGNSPYQPLSSFAGNWLLISPDALIEDGLLCARGPGADFFEAVRREFGGMPFIAEDLGMITPEVLALREGCGLPGMRVMQFGFDGDPENPHLPRTWTNSTVAYTGTHDNNTTRGWFEALPNGQKQLVRNYIGGSAEDGDGIAAALMRSAWPSAAGLTIAPLQDVLNLGMEARMNVPGRAQGNWQWRWAESATSEQAFRWLAELTSTSGRGRDPMPLTVPATAQPNREPILSAVPSAQAARPLCAVEK